MDAHKRFCGSIGSPMKENACVPVHCPKYTNPGINGHMPQNHKLVELIHQGTVGYGLKPRTRRETMAELNPT